MSMKLAVLGVGGIGGPLGAFLTNAGHDVVLIDQWSPHVEAMKADGLHMIVGPKEDPEAEFTVPVRALEVHEVCTLRDSFDVVFLACKSYDTRWMGQLIEPYLLPEGVVVSVQNSLNNEWLAPIIGEGRGIGCTLFGGGELLTPGHVWRTHPMYKQMYTLGELDGSDTARLEAVAGLMGEAGVTNTTSNIKGLQWTKVILTTFSAVFSALLDPIRRTWELAEIPLYRQLAGRLYREGAAVADAFGADLVPLYGVPADELLSSFEEAIQGVLKGNSEAHSKGATNMIQQDLLRGRPTEVRYLNGLIARKGAEAKIPTPVNDALTALFLRLERREITQSIGNLELLAADVAAKDRSGPVGASA